MPIYRQKEMKRVPEYACQAEAEEASGDFTRDPHTWYPKGKSEQTTTAAAPPIRRATDGKPNLGGYYSPQAPGANYGLEEHKEGFGFPEGPGFIIDPPDKKLPMQDWAKAEQQDRMGPERGYEDPMAHCFASGVPRSMYTSSFQILQRPGYVVFFFERMAHRIIPLDGRSHVPDQLSGYRHRSTGVYAALNHCICAQEEAAGTARGRLSGRQPRPETSKRRSRCSHQGEEQHTRR